MVDKIGRNAPCVCGSGKKFKKCCAIQGGGRLDRNKTFNMHVNLAQQAMSLGDLLAAESSFRAALIVEKDSALVLAELGQCLCLSDKKNEGVECLFKAGVLFSQQGKESLKTKPVLNLAYLLLQHHAFAKALSLADAVIEQQKDCARAHYIKCMCLQRLNRKSKALLAAKRAYMLEPCDPNVAIMLSVLEVDADSARQRLENVIANSAVKSDCAILARANLELGIILDRQGVYDKAFEHISCSKQLLMHTQEAKKIDAHAVYRDVEQNKLIFATKSSQLLVSKTIDDGLASPVFLIGFYRSGTTLIEQILASHSQVVTSDEASLIPDVLREFYAITPKGSQMERMLSLDTQQVKYLRGYYWDVVKRQFGGQLEGKIFVDKTTLNTINLAFINLLFPHSKIIFAVRDPRDVCLSCFMQSFVLSTLTVQFLSWEKTADFYALILDYWIAIRGSLAPSWVEIKYENLVSNNLESELRPTFNLLGLGWERECEDFYLHARGRSLKTPSFGQVTQPVFQSSVQRWRHYKSHYQLILSTLQPFLIEFGYER